MESSGSWIFLDRDGQPLSERLQQALRNVLPQLRNQFRSLNNDELLVAEILEEAGSRVEDHERTHGQVENLDAYAWRTVQNVAKSRLRRWSLRLFRAMLSSSDSEAVLETLPAQFGSAEQIECDIEYREIQMQLTVPEQHLLAYKKLGLSSREIAREEGLSIVSVNTQFYRIKRKIRALRKSGADASLTGTPQPTKPRPA
jgi:DNA-directed RNA polymerase specialized sigma24 family protein